MCQIVKIMDYLRIKNISKHLQHQDKTKQNVPWQCNLLSVDYSRLSQAAHLCSMHHIAALMLELSMDPIL